MHENKKYSSCIAKKNGFSGMLSEMQMRTFTPRNLCGVLFSIGLCIVINYYGMDLYDIWNIIVVFCFHLVLFLCMGTAMHAPRCPGTTSRFSSREHFGQYDAIVIGSGPAGLFCACSLVKKGQKVLLLESHYRIGGGLHTFDGFTTGFHYVGKSFSKHLARFPLASGKQFPQFQRTGDPPAFAYDRFFFPDEPLEDFAFVAGKENLRAKLYETFPHEHKAVDDWFQVLQDTERGNQILFASKLLPDLILQYMWPFLKKIFQKYHLNLTVQEVLDKRLSGASNTLKARLSALFANMGLPPSQLSWVAYSGCFNHFAEGGYYPVGGPDAIVHHLQAYLMEKSADIRTQAHVKKIVTESGKVRGVEVAVKHGLSKFVAAKKVVSAVGIRNTSKLTPCVVAPTNINNSIGHVCGFIRLQRDANVPSTNLWIMPSRLNSASVFIKFQGRKAHVIMESPKRLFQDFASLSHRARTKCVAYQELKTSWVTAIRDIFKSCFPKEASTIGNIQLGTPLSTADYLHSESGCSYGLAHTVERFVNYGCWSQLRPRTNIRGLYLTGQDIITAGSAGAAISGYLTAIEIMGLQTIL